MQRRDFILKSTASIIAAEMAMTGCSTTATSTVTPQVSGADKRRQDIDAGVQATLARLTTIVPDARELIGKASGALVFPNVLAAGFGVGGQFGEGALRVRQSTVGHYSLVSLSVGLQIGAQSKAIIFLFMTPDALDRFRASKGWQIGADASVAVLKVGANGNVDVGAATGPVVAFVLTNAGLMANLTLEGTKITPLTI